MVHFSENKQYFDQFGPKMTISQKTKIVLYPSQMFNLISDKILRTVRLYFKIHLGPNMPKTCVF